jgi:diguanylate cyclase (GGDEF)-like protein
MGHGDAAIGVLSPWGTAGWDDRRALEIGAIHLCSMQCRDDYLVHKRKDGTTLRVRLSGREVKGKQGKMDGYEIIAEDVTKQRELEDHLRQQAAKDPLTGLANYRHLVGVLDSEIKRSKRTGREFALLLLDLDQLKQINDRYGHVTGSQALCRLADVLCICCRDIDTPARFGGDEFALVLPEIGAESANLVAQRICDTFANDGRERKLSVSAGVAIYPRDADRIVRSRCRNVRDEGPAAHPHSERPRPVSG